MRKPICRLNAVVENTRVCLTWYKSTPMFKEDNADEFKLLRVFRKETEFVFGEDYEEYFFNMDSQDAEVIFEGTLEALNNRKYEYWDDTAETGKTYAYFIQTKSSGRIGPAAAKIRDPEVWWTYDRLMSEIQQICDASAGLARWDICGHTADGREIPCVRVGNGRQVMGLVGVIHGGESGPELMIPALSRLISGSPEFFTHTSVIAIPSVNIDSREQLSRGTPWYIRTNRQGVDLNRNFPVQWETVEYGYGQDSSDPTSLTYRGTAPASAPETRAVVNAFKNVRPRAVFSYHFLASICEFPALVSRYAKDDDAYMAECRDIIRVFGNGMHPDLGFSDNWLRPLCSAGSLPAWFYEQDRIPAFDLEGCVNTQALPICKFDRTDRKIVTEYQQRHALAMHRLLDKWTGIA